MKLSYVAAGILVILILASVGVLLETQTQEPETIPQPTTFEIAGIIKLPVVFDSPTPKPSSTLPPILPTPTTGVAVPTQAQASNRSHLVQRGETLFRIAQNYGVTTDSILSANNLTNGDVIFAGQLLSIPTLPESTIVPLVAINDLPTQTPYRLGIFAPPASPTVPAMEMLNGMSLDTLIVFPASVQIHVQEIYAHGQTVGRNPHAFSKLGDSTIENPHFLDRFDTGTYNLGLYQHLEPTVQHYAGSYSRRSIAVRRSLHSWSVFDPLWADGRFCLPNENILACELRVHNPSAIFIRLGANDVGVPDSFESNMRRIVEYCIENGVIPLLGTKADRNEGAGNINNDIVRQIAEDYQVPLWDFDLVAATLPGRGLGRDNVHMTTFFEYDYTLATAFERGYGVHNLLALLTLDAVRRETQTR